MNDYILTDIIDELTEDESWCEDPAERKSLTAALENLLITS